MRRIMRKERVQRGCAYCMFSVMKSWGGSNWRHCPYDECPYRELDKYKTYREYLEKEGLNIRLTIDLIGKKFSRK